MSSRRLIGPFPVIEDGVMASASIISDVTIIQTLSMVSYAVSWAGSTPIGVLSVQVSNDYSQNSDGTVRNTGTWNTMSLQVGGSAVASIPVTGNTGNGFIDILQSAAYAMRLVYTRTSGTGSMDAVVTAKVA